MSTILLRYKPELKGKLIDPVREELIAKLAEVTAKLLNKNSTEVIIEMEAWNEVINSPDVLFRGETSMSRRPLIKEWARLILSAWNEVTVNLEKGESFRVAVKTYVIDSEWLEE